MLVVAQAGEAQAAEGFLEGPEIKKSNIGGTCWGGAVLTACRPQRGLYNVIKIIPNAGAGSGW